MSREVWGRARERQDIEFSQVRLYQRLEGGLPLFMRNLGWIIIRAGSAFGRGQHNTCAAAQGREGQLGPTHPGE
jgi:hypothetical protein